MEPKTWNRYGYCWNNPVGFVDLNGRTPELPFLQMQPTNSESIVPDLFNMPEKKSEKTAVESSLPDLSPYMPKEQTNTDKPKEKSTMSSLPPFDSRKTPLKASIEFGAGLYYEGKVGGAESSIGFKDYVEFNTQNPKYFLWGVEAGVGAKSGVASLEAGGEYVWCPMLDDRVMEKVFFNADLLKFREEDGDIYFNLGAELYVAIGGIDVELNISECLRRIFPINKD